jgi:flagellar protein FlbD
MDQAVILVTRLSGEVFALNPDLIERAEATPDTIVTLLDGAKYVICESMDELIGLIHQHRASVVAQAQKIEFGVADAPRVRAPKTVTKSNVVPLHGRER